MADTFTSLLTSSNIDKINKSISDVELNIVSMTNFLAQLTTHRDNIKSFYTRMGHLMDGSDGIFGVLSDEVIVLILQKIRMKELMIPPCRRFYVLREHIAKVRMANRLRNAPGGIKNKLITKVFKHPCVYVCVIEKYGLFEITNFINSYNIKLRVPGKGTTDISIHNSVVTIKFISEYTEHKYVKTKKDIRINAPRGVDLIIHKDTLKINYLEGSPCTTFYKYLLDNVL
jgi:hypothetical protein